MVEFTEEQQEYVDRLVGQARMKARDQAESRLAELKEEQERAALEAKQEWETLAKQHEEELASLRPTLEQYQEVLEDVYNSRVEALDDRAKKLLDAFPEQMSLVDKLKWIASNDELLKPEPVGTPTRDTRVKGAGAKEFRTPKPRL